MHLSPGDEAVLLSCYDTAKWLVRSVLGFFDDDLAQEAREAMIVAVGTFDPAQGTTLRTWILLKARWRIVDAYRERTRVRLSHHTGKDIPISLQFDPGDELILKGGVPLDALIYPGDDFERVDEVITAETTVQRLRIPWAMRKFSERDQLIIKTHLSGVPLAVVGDQWGLTEGRISQIMKRFRSYLTPLPPEDSDRRRTRTKHDYASGSI